MGAPFFKLFIMEVKRKYIYKLGDYIDTKNGKSDIIYMGESKNSLPKRRKILSQCKCCKKEIEINIYNITKGGSVYGLCTNCRKRNNIDSVIKRENKNTNAVLDSPSYKVYKAYKSNAHLNNWTFELTEQDALKLFNSNCYYCNTKPRKRVVNYGKKKVEITINGIDRIDSCLGYTSNNVRPCCTMCNRMKLNYTESDFLDKVKLIYKNLINEKKIYTKRTNSVHHKIKTR